MTDAAPAITIQDEVLDFLVSSPTPEQILAFHASDAARERLTYLLEASRYGSLSDEEQAELDEVSQTNYVFVLLKAKARQALHDE